MNFPEELKYSKDHAWLKLDGDVAILGITDHAQKELGDIVYVDVESEGESFDKDEVYGSVEAVKTVSDLFIPIAGEVLEFNEDVDDEPELINSDPYGKAWIVKVKVANPEELSELLTAEAYKSLIGA